jgi:hypothetical protein
VEAHSVAYALSLGLLLFVWRWLVRQRARQARSGRLVFDDAAASSLTVLDLDYRPTVPSESAPGCC